MSSRLLVAFLCLAAVSTGCIIHNEDDDCCVTNPPPTAYPGDVTFRWTLGGLRCDEAPDIKGVNITIPGERLANDGRYPCWANGFDGIVLHDFVPGTYSFKLEAVNYSNETVYVASGTFSVNGDVSVDIDLTPVGSPPSFAYVSWLFPANTTSQNPNCNQAGVAFVDARVDGGDWARVDCTEGQGGNSIRTPYLEPGTHYLELVALDAQLRSVYTYAGELTTKAGVPTSHTASLRATGSNASIRWQFVDGSTTLGCGQAGVTQVDVRVDDGQWTRFECAAGSGGGSITSPTLQPGAHFLEMVALNAQGQPWYYYNGDFSTQAGATTSKTASMWVVGGASIKWNIMLGSSFMTCSEAKLTDVRINFRDVFTNELVYGIFGDGHGCNDAPVVFEFLRPGRYEVEMYARASDGREFRSADNGPLVDVVGHQFPAASSALPVTLFGL